MSTFMTNTNKRLNSYRTKDNVHQKLQNAIPDNEISKHVHERCFSNY